MFASSIPINLFTLFGICIANVIVSNAISAYKYGTAFRGSQPLEKQETLPSISTMLTEHNDIQLTRLQLFTWIWIAITIYLLNFFTILARIIGPTQNFLVPDIDST
jgi:hypothetical protein